MKHGGLVEFAAGMAVIMAPAPVNAYVLAVTAGVRAARAALVHRRHRRRSGAVVAAAPLPDADADAGADGVDAPLPQVPPVTLEFDVTAKLLPDKKALKAAAAAAKKKKNNNNNKVGGDEDDDGDDDDAAGPPPPPLVRTVLDGVAGAAKPGRVLAIMGPSGSGKTTLLNALAGQVPARSRIRVEGYVGVNGAPQQQQRQQQQRQGQGQGPKPQGPAADAAAPAPPRPATPPRAAYVQQDDNFFSMLTAQETLETHASLLLPPSVPEPERAARAARLLAALGLSRVAGARVGGARARGLSGGERKRLAIACELIASPSLLFLDEPTTGLDAFQAGRVVDALRELARARGHTVVAVVHQPRSSIFASFDDLLLVAEGRALYYGEAGRALAWFASQGHACPDHYNPAEFLADLASADTSSPAAEEASRARVAALADAWAAGAGARAAKRAAAKAGRVAIAAGGAPAGDQEEEEEEEKGDGSDDDDDDDKGEAASSAAAVAHHHHHRSHHEGGAGPGRQFALLLRRSWRQISRDASARAARLASNLSSALMFGAIFFRMGRSQASVKDRLGLLQVCAINAAMSSLVKTLNVFPRERLLVQRERARGAYGATPYLAAKLVAELPVSALYPAAFGAVVYPLTGLRATPRAFASFLGVITLESFSASALGLAVGACAPSTEAAVALGPAFMLLHILFGGAYISAESVPGPLKALPGQSLIRQSYEALVVNEFSGIGDFSPDGAAAGGGGGAAAAATIRSGEDALRFFGFGDTTVAGACGRQARILATYWWLCFCLLKAGRPRFATLHRPQNAPTGAAAAAEAAAEEAETAAELAEAEASMAAMVG
jgi:ABC-type multidrug transport system ATPase subunit